MISMGKTINNSIFADNFILYRSKGFWKKGRFVLDETYSLKFYSAVQQAQGKELEQFPEGDRQKGIMKFFCEPPNKFYLTCDLGNDENNYVSDEIEYKESRYKIIKVDDWSKYGYYRAYAIKVS